MRLRIARHFEFEIEIPDVPDHLPAHNDDDPIGKRVLEAISLGDLSDGEILEITQMWSAAFKRRAEQLKYQLR